MKRTTDVNGPDEPGWFFPVSYLLVWLNLCLLVADVLVASACVSPIYGCSW